MDPAQPSRSRVLGAADAYEPKRPGPPRCRVPRPQLQAHPDTGRASLADRLTELRGDVRLRAIRPGDREFLLALYGSTREDELRLLLWGAPEWALFIGQQFTAQDRQYRATYPEGRFALVELGGSPVGRLYVVRLSDQLHIIDIALMPAYRGQGIGSALLAGLLAEADDAGIAVTLHVQPQNPAKRLYERLGFRRRGNGSVYDFMERPARAVS